MHNLVTAASLQLHSLSREHGKLKAAHLKMLQEMEQRETQLSQASAAKEKAMEEQREATAAHMIQETRMQATIAQQSKLIDFLRNASPPSRSRLKLKVICLAYLSHCSLCFGRGFLCLLLFVCPCFCTIVLLFVCPCFCTIVLLFVCPCCLHVCTGRVSVYSVQLYILHEL